MGRILVVFKNTVGLRAVSKVLHHSALGEEGIVRTETFSRWCQGALRAPAQHLHQHRGHPVCSLAVGSSTPRSPFHLVVFGVLLVQLVHQTMGHPDLHPVPVHVKSMHQRAELLGSAGALVAWYQLCKNSRNSIEILKRNFSVIPRKISSVHY